MADVLKKKQQDKYIIETGVTQIGASGETISFTKSFPDSPAVCVTASGSSTALRAPIVTARSSTSFTVKVLNGSGSGVQSYVNWIAVYEIT